MTPEDITTIRNLRAFNVAWPVVAKTLKATIQECRAAIGLPEYQRTEITSECMHPEGRTCNRCSK